MTLPFRAAFANFSSRICSWVFTASNLNPGDLMSGDLLLVLVFFCSQALLFEAALLARRSRAY
jgi:hypothetical protein